VETVWSSLLLFVFLFLNRGIMNTLSDLIKLFPDHLKGPRTDGSITEIGLEGLSDRPVVEFRPKHGAVEAVKYYRVDCPEIQGRLGAVRLADLDESLHTLVRVKNDGDQHEFSFYLDQDQADAELVPVDYATVGIGPIDDAGTLGAWFWHPGEPMGSMAKKTMHETVCADLAVKLFR
jgi:hypothetical protein